MIIKNITIGWIDPETKIQYQVNAIVEKRTRANRIDIKRVLIDGVAQYQPFSDEQVNSMKEAINTKVNEI